MINFCPTNGKVYELLLQVLYMYSSFFLLYRADSILHSISDSKVKLSE